MALTFLLHISEAAAKKAYTNREAVPWEQFDVAFEAFEKWIVDKAVLPIEDSLGRSIHRNYDHFLRHSLCVVGEVKLTVLHCLFAYHSVKIEDLERVLSHSEYDAITQFKNRLTKLSLGREAVDDTAFAAEANAQDKFMRIKHA